MHCYIIGALTQVPELPEPEEGSLLIAADAGYAVLARLGRRPDLTVGDFDSLGFIPSGPVVRHPVEKDDTDTLLAVREGLRRGCDRFYIYGGIGGRLDHTLANLQTLAFVRAHGAHAFLTGDGWTATLIDSETLCLPRTSPGTLSVFASGGAAHGVTLEGLHYTLDGAELEPSFPLGVSNDSLGEPVRIRVQSGRLLVLWETHVADARTALISGSQ